MSERLGDSPRPRSGAVVRCEVCGEPEHQHQITLSGEEHPVGARYLICRRCR